MSGLRLPQLPPRDLECIAAAPGPYSAPAAPSSAPNSAGAYLPPPLSAHPKLDGSPADVSDTRAYTNPLLLRSAVSPSHPSTGLVLPTLSLPLPHPNVLPPVSRPRVVARTAPVSPQTTAQMSQNEIKKAQNRKSAKRFREAQKQRWKNMADDLMMQKRTIEELRQQLAAQSLQLQHANEQLRLQSDKRSSMSINDLVEQPNNNSDAVLPPISTHPHLPAVSSNTASHSDAEAALYAQILSNFSHNTGETGKRQPYALELGSLSVCAVVTAADARVVSVQRGSTAFGSFIIDGLTAEGQSEFRRALVAGKPVALNYARRGEIVNAVMNPVQNSDRVLVAEFKPF